MTRADDFHNEIASALEYGTHEDQSRIVSTFFSRTDWRKWKFRDCVEVYENSWRIRIQVFDTKRTVIIGHNCTGNRWTWGSGVIASANLAERLGVPVAYLDGLTDSMKWLADHHNHVQRVKAAIATATDDLKRRKRLLKQQEDRIVSGGVVKKEVRSATRKAGQKTAKLIARLRAEMAAAQFAAQPTPWPAVPAPTASPVANKSDSELPASSGVYFVWREGVVVYVGQSICLANRTVLSHERIEKDDIIGWVEVERESLNFAESYYIALCKPRLNFNAKS
jgi:hypothetical protein